LPTELPLPRRLAWASDTTIDNALTAIITVAKNFFMFPPEVSHCARGGGISTPFTTHAMLRKLGNQKKRINLDFFFDKS
jgi:hypothetical protein